MSLVEYRSPEPFNRVNLEGHYLTLHKTQPGREEWLLKGCLLRILRAHTGSCSSEDWSCWNADISSNNMNMNIMQIWIWKMILKDMRLHKSCWLADTKLIPLHNIKWYPVLLTHKKHSKDTSPLVMCPESSSMTLMQKVKVSRKTCVAAGWHRTQL